MREFISKLANKAVLWLQRTNEVARFDGIVLADLCHRENSTRHFRDILLAALRLLKETDPYRFARVRRRLSWIVYLTLARRGVAEYRHATRTCAIDFLEPSPEYDREFLIGWYASVLVHEATHGVIRSRGIPYTSELRSRIEQLCVREEQRFVTRLAFTQPALADRVYYGFDASEWDWHWRSTPAERLRAEMMRILGWSRRD